MAIDNKVLQEDITRAVTQALLEDLNGGPENDLSAQLIPEDKLDNASVITREDCVVCGQAWFDETFKQLDKAIQVQWLVDEGESVTANTELLRLNGNTRLLLTGERTALNFLQLLSGVATRARYFASLLKGKPLKLLDTRKTLPGLRLAQKYAVEVGGCHNHRVGLYDAFLIKENHIKACGGISEAIAKARAIAPGKTVEVEVENLLELDEALKGGADIIMLDNFSDADIQQVANIDAGDVQFEISGNLDEEALRKFDYTHIHRASLGVLTKSCRAVDLSFRVV